MLSQFVLLPAMTFALLALWRPDAGLALGLLLVAACPGGNISNFISAMARADVALSVSLTAVSTLLCVFLTPLNFGFWAGLLPEVQGLLRGDPVLAKLEDGEHPVRFLNPELGLINLDDPVPLHVSAMGPKSRRFTADLGAAWLNFSGSVEPALKHMRDMRNAWRDAGQAENHLRSTLFALGCVLEEGEAADSPRAMAQAGPCAAVVLHDLAETSVAGSLEGKMPPKLVSAVERYREVWQGFPAAERHLYNHRGHLMFLREDERDLLDADLIRALTFTGTREDLAERIKSLGDAGYDQFVVQLVEGPERALDDWAEVFSLV
jgi:5,10-methylenetetrahydromethanopterin reductase